LILCGGVVEMPPLPYPYRVAFLAPALTLPDDPAMTLPDDAAPPLSYAKLLGALVADQLARHPVVSVLDFDDQVLVDASDRLLDARHPDADATIDALFRSARRDEVLWLELDLTQSAPVTLRSRRPRVPEDQWTAVDGTLDERIGACVQLWLASRRLPPAPALPDFEESDLRLAAARLDRAVSASTPTDENPDPVIPEEMLTPPTRLGVAFLRALHNLSRNDPRVIDERLLALDPEHLAARRNHVLAHLGEPGNSRRDLLAITDAAPMFGKPHLAIHGDEIDPGEENASLRHQGIAAQLLPSNPRACCNYGAQLKEAGRPEEAARWFDRALVARPGHHGADLDAIRALRECQRPGATYAETVRRASALLQAWRGGGVAPGEWAVKYHAGMLIAAALVDVGRLDDAIGIGTDTMADFLDPEGGDSFRWAYDRLDEWQKDPDLFARAYAWEGFHRGELGRVLAGLGRARLASPEDARQLVDALVALGREDEAAIAFHHASGVDRIGVLGFGKTRIAGAMALVLTGDLDGAIAQMHTAQLRRSQYRLEAAINRLLRLAATHSAEAWSAAVMRLAERGATTLARWAARDLADFVPGIGATAAGALLGELKVQAVDADACARFANELALPPDIAKRIDSRIARPADATLAAADRLASKWFTCVPPPARDAALHASSAVYALGVSLAQYLALAGGASVLAGAYRQIATEALHLCQRARKDVGDAAARGLLALLDATTAPDEVLERWLMRIERALELEARLGGHLPVVVSDLPRVRTLLRGDERIAWELRLAHDLRADPSQREPAERLFARVAVAADDWATFRSWSDTAAAALPPAAALDVHWICARANPGTNAVAWVNAGKALFALGRGNEAVDVLSMAYANTGDEWRAGSIASLEEAWSAAAPDVPFAGDAASAAGNDAIQARDWLRAERCLRWCQARAPRDADIARRLGAALAAQGKVGETVRAMAVVDRDAAALHAGVALANAGRWVESALALRYASHRFRTVEEWQYLATAGWYAGDHEAAADAYRAILALGAPADTATLHYFLVSLTQSGQWSEAEQVSQRLGREAGADPTYGAVAAHGRAVALCGLGRHTEALPWAERAAATNPVPERTAELAATVACARNRSTPPYHAPRSASGSARALAALAASDVAAAEKLAPTAGPLSLARLVVAEVRKPSENDRLVSPRAVEAAGDILDRTAGTTTPAEALVRVRALRVIDDAFIQIDPPPPLGANVPSAELDRRWRERCR
jgi:tetratricopeptide (TPR) repeat protein